MCRGAGRIGLGEAGGYKQEEEGEEGARGDYSTAVVSNQTDLTTGLTFHLKFAN